MEPSSEIRTAVNLAAALPAWAKATNVEAAPVNRFQGLRLIGLLAGHSRAPRPSRHSVLAAASCLKSSRLAPTRLISTQRSGPRRKQHRDQAQKLRICSKVSQTQTDAHQPSASDFFWVAVWISPASYNTGSLSYPGYCQGYEGSLAVEPIKDVGSCERFQCCGGHRRPASESLQRRNPREGYERGCGRCYGDLTAAEGAPDWA
jgi:hypothetical protein